MTNNIHSNSASAKSRAWRNRTNALLLGVSLVALAASGASAATKTFGGSGSSSNWSDGANWDLGAPSGGDNVVISQFGSNAPSNDDIIGTFASLDLETSSNATTFDNGYNVGGSGIFGLQSGGTITDNAANTLADQLNMAIALNGPATVSLGSSATGLIIGGSISGTGGLTIDDQSSSGLITLSGSNTYTGGTTISHGTLSVSADANLGNSAGGIAINNGSTLQLTSGFANSRNVVLGAGMETIDTLSGPNASYIFNGVISGAGGLNKTSGGALILTNTNTYTGGTTIAAGSLSLGALTGSTGGSVVGNITDNGQLFFNRTDDLTFSNVISGTGSVIKNFGNTLTFTNNNTYNGTTTVSAGTLQLGNGGTGGMVAGDISLGGTTDVSGHILTHSTLVFDHSNDITFAGTISGIGALDKKGNDTLTLTGNDFYLSGTTIESGTLQIGNGGTTGSIIGDVVDNGNLAINLATPAMLVLNGVISGSGALTQIGTGTTILGNDNTYTGGTVISAGTLQIGNGGTTGAVVGDITDNSVLAFSPGTSLVGGLTTPVVFNYGGVISGTGALSKIGGGTLVLTGENTFGGGTTISGGMLQIGNGGTTGSITGAVNDMASLVFDHSDAVSFGGNITGTGSVTQMGGNTLTLGGANTFSGGLNVAAGTVAVSSQSNLGTGSVSVTNGATLDLGAAAYTSPVAFGTGGGNISVTAGSASLSGNLTGAGAFAKTGSGTLILTGSDGLATTISAGTLQIGNGGTSGSIAGNVLDNGNLAFDRSDNITENNVISGSGSVQKLGAGKLTLSGTNTYTGDTNVGTGSISIATDANLGNGGTLNMAANTTLFITQSGTFTHDVTLTGDPTFNVLPANTDVWSGEIDDGASAGTLEVNGGGTLQLTNTGNTYSGGTIVRGGSTLQIDADGELGATTGGLTLGDATTAGTLDVTSTMTLASTRPVSLGAGNATIKTETGVVLTAGQAISGSGMLTVAGPGTLILSGDNTYTGGTTVSGNLQLGDNTTTGTVAGNIADNGTVTFDLLGINTFAGTISGTGSLTQEVAVLKLTADNTYTGGTTITAGSVLNLGDGGTTGSVAGNIVDNGDLEFERSDTITYGGVISGTGDLFQLGAGTLILTGDSTYTGFTDIVAGTLQLGNGGTAGSIADTSDMTDNGILAFDRADSLTFAALIAGGGSVQQIGAGTTILTADNTYIGGTTITAGTLQLGSGGTAGSIVGDVTDNAALAIDHSNAVTLSGAITGTGALSQIGTGTTTLTGTNTYSGGTTVSAGTLQVGDGTTVGSITGNVVDNATLAFDHSDGVTFAGVISGSGALNQLGTGLLTLTGNNTFTGLTTISAGSVQIGNGGTSGALAGNVADNSALAFDRSDSVTYGGTISSTGSVSQIGAGTTIFTGTDTYTGGTTISAGILQLGNATSTGSIVGDIADNATLAFDRTNALTLAGIISGSGAVKQIGAGTTTLSATNTYSGPTSVNAGTLLVDGSIASSATTVNTGGTLGGTGTVGALTVANGGAVTPGDNGVGTLNVHGNASFSNTSLTLIDATSASNDLIDVSGAASLNGTLSVISTGTGYTAGQKLTVLTATGGVSGTYSSLLATGFGPNLVAILGYDTDDAFLTLAPSAITPLLPAGTSSNGQSVAAAIDFAIAHRNGAATFAGFGSLTNAEIDTALSQMAGETGPAFQNIANVTVDTFLGSLLDPSVGGRGGLGDGGAAQKFADNQPYMLAYNGNSDVPYERGSRRAVMLWGDLHGAHNETDGSTTLGTHDTAANTFGGEFGLDYTPASGRGAIGIAGDIGSTNWKLATDTGKGRATTYQFGAYYSRMFGPNYFSAAAAYTNYQVTTTRDVVFGGTNTYQAKFTANSSSARFEYGHIFDTGSDTLTPYLRGQASDLGTPNYAETTTAGSSAFALAYTRKQHYDYTSELGLAWNTILASHSDTMTDLHARLGWIHDYVNGLTDTATFSSFAGASFTVNGAPPAKNAAHLALGIEHDFDNIALGLNADSQLAGSAQSYGGNASISFRW